MRPSANDIEYDRPEVPQNRLAYVMLLDAILTWPDAMIRGHRYVRGDMVRADLGARLPPNTASPKGWGFHAAAPPSCRS